MTEQSNGSGQTAFDLLKERARLMGIVFSNNIGEETLRQRVNAMLAGDGTEAQAQAEAFDADIEEEEAEQEEILPKTETLTQAKVAETKMVLNQIKPKRGDAELGTTPRGAQTIPISHKKVTGWKANLIAENMKLVRVRIQNLDPKKKDLEGEILTVANKILGNVKMFVPYGEATDDGWHIPYVIYKALERRRFLHIRTVKDKVTKRTETKKSWAKEFAIDILPPLTMQELEDLKRAQAAAGSVDGNSNSINI